ncbi:MAG: secondary thiamine-phosphate synthase enzyme YjbQ [Candidatus Hodarchaeales archaeon]
MQEHEIQLKSTGREEVIDITKNVKKLVKEHGSNFNGLCVLFVPHTTAAITVNENADPSVSEDLLYCLSNIIPWNDPRYGHLEGNSAAHAKAVCTGSNVTIPVMKGKLKLGHWQGILFCEFDGPRSRKVKVYFH